MNLLENRQFGDVRFVGPNELVLVDTVLIETLQAVELHDIIVPQELAKLFVLVSEIAVTSIRAILVVVELTAFCFNRWFPSLEISLIIKAMLVSTVFPKPTCACLKPVFTGLSSHPCCILDHWWAFSGHLHTLSHLKVSLLVHREARIKFRSHLIEVIDRLPGHKGL